MRPVIFVALLLHAFCCSIAIAQDKPPAATPAAKYNVLLKEFDKAQKDYLKAFEKAASVAEQGKLFREQNPQPAFAARFLELAKTHPKEPAAYASLVWVIGTSEFGPASVKPYAEAIALLAARHADHEDSEELLERLSESPFPSAGQLLQAIHEKHPSRITRGRAAFYWALYLKNYCDTAYLLSVNPELAKNLELFVGPELFKQLKEADSAQHLAQAETLFALVQKEHALTAHKRTVLGKAAEKELFALRNLGIGKTAPEIEGEDIDGKPIKLSDYRGRVTVVVFWGTWCPHCMKMVPQERELVKRYERKPFAMLGVNSDPRGDKLSAAVKKQSITWRSFWDGGNTEGPIATRWNVQGWPTVYVLDAKGVIRYKHVRDEVLDRAVAELMKGANAK